MSSPAEVTIKNFTKRSITMNVTRNSWVVEDGSSIDSAVIPEGVNKLFTVEAKTNHHGELDIQLIGGAGGVELGTFNIKSIKDPQEGEKSLEVTSNQDDIDMSAMGYRRSIGNSDLRRIDLIVAQR